MRVVISPQALDDIGELRGWLLERSPRAAGAAASALRRKFDLLSEFPLSGPLQAEGHREIVVEFGRDGFIVRYRATETAVTILRVFHGRQAR